VRSPGGELDDFETALDVALGIVDRLAVFAREELGERRHLALHQVEEAQQHPRTLLRVGRGPGDLGLLGVGDHPADLLGRRQRHPRLHGTGARIEHIGEATGVGSEKRSAYEMGDGTSHCVTSLRAVIGTLRSLLWPPEIY